MSRQLSAPRNLILMLLSLVMMLSLAGCKSAEDKAADKLVGTWEADMSEMTIEGMPEDQMEQMSAMMASASMQVTLNEDGSTSVHSEMMGQVQDEEGGTWEVSSVDGDVVQIEGDDSDGEHSERTITFSDDDHFVMTMEQNGSTVTVPMHRTE